jgi:hypothetical protein
MNDLTDEQYKQMAAETIRAIHLHDDIFNLINDMCVPNHMTLDSDDAPWNEPDEIEEETNLEDYNNEYNPDDI